VSVEPIVLVIGDDDGVGRSLVAALDAARIPGRLYTRVERLLSGRPAAAG
jgi:hypothetical protein